MTPSINTIILTSIYGEFWGTEEFRKSCARHNLPIHNAWKGKNFDGHGSSLRYYYEALKELKSRYKYVIYCDGADSLILKPVQVPDFALYSAEKAVWPPTAEMNRMWAEIHAVEPPKSDWKYLNGGEWSGPIDLMIEFYERYGLHKYTGDINGQGEQVVAYYQAKKDGFPIFLDDECKYYQTTGFEHPGDFQLDKDKFINLRTGTEPHILHGNGRTDMTHLYNLYNRN